MKTKSLLLVALLAMASSVSAQFANTSVSSGGNQMRNVDTDGWEKVYGSYNPMKMFDDEDDIDFTGFSLGYSKGFSISKDFPLFAEVGLEGTYAFKTMDAEDLGYDDYYDDYDIDVKMTYLGVSVPVNLGYKFTLAEKNLSFVPYVGVNLKGNIIGKMKLEAEGEEEELNFFDKDDVGDKDYQWKRIQFGYQLGIGLYYNQLYVGVGYSKDLSELCKKTKMSKTSITLGYTF